MLDGKNLRELDSVSTYEYAIDFANQKYNLFSALNSEHNLEVRQLQSDLKTASLYMNLDQAQLSFNSYDSSWQFDCKNSRTLRIRITHKNPKKLRHPRNRRSQKISRTFLNCSHQWFA